MFTSARSAGLRWLAITASAAVAATTALLPASAATSSASAPASVPGSAPDDAAPPDDPFFTYSRPAEYDVVREDVTVPVRDGSHLVCQLYRPGISPTAPAEGTYPGIVYEFTAYAQNAEAFGEGARYFVERGYNALVCQARGSGDSPGTLDPFGPQEQRDNYDVIEWLAAHPASTGDIGQMGVSYGGHSTLLAAVNQPPHLRAIIPINAIHDWYENTIYRGGIPNAAIRDWQRSTAPDTLVTYPRHPLYDDFWRERSVMSRWDRLTIPTLEINGWYDRYRDGMVKNYQARPDNVWLVSGPWQHGYPEGQPADIGRGGYLAWWDRWLRHDDGAPLPEARVMSYEVPGSGWHQFDEWPPAQARDVTLALTRGGSLSTSSGRPGRAGPGTTTFEVNTDPASPAPGEQLLFATAPVRDDVVLAGSPRAEIRAAFTATDGNIAAIVYDEAPDGTRTRITQGWLKASHRQSHAEPVPVEPGRTYTLGVHVWPTHYRLDAGHRLVLRVSSDDYPEIDSVAPTGVVSVRVGARGSTLTVPVLEGSLR
ncbi:CocE/NonD family hydrolase [Promicromonospora panici]|uniref:CocE/NonD family hydrolase n=1 Tax=Promicromonospora panici TaxID=2219658 RepID=UPI00101C048A|nr:CocE/NonD family hydrolase [Promicromonospora panici]